MRDLERTPVLAHDVGVLSKKAQQDIRRLAKKLVAEGNSVDARWKRRLPGIFGKKPAQDQLKALAAITPGAHWPLLADGKWAEFLEHIEYHGRRLAKLDVPPQLVLDSLEQYEEALLPQLKNGSTSTATTHASALEKLSFWIKLTLKDAYYQVRDLEAEAFFQLFQGQLDSSSTPDLLASVLETLIRSFRASCGFILLREPKSSRFVVRACEGIEEELAASFNTASGRGFTGHIVKSREGRFTADVASESLIRSAGVKDQLRSLWGVPLHVRDEVTGVLYLGFGHEYHCLSRERKLLDAIAERCALAIDRVKLLDELRQREDQIRQLGEHVLHAQEEERRRISRELHDEVGQSLLVMRLYIEMIQSDLPKTAKKVAGKLEETRALAESTIQEMRRLIAALSPSVLEELGLQASIRHVVNNFSRTFPGDVSLRMAEFKNLPKGTEIMIYRLVQECFSNAVKHSSASRISLQVERRNGHIRLSVNDNGVGFDVKRAHKKEGSFGLNGMRERVELLGGKIDVQSSPGKGTKIRIALPS